MSAGILPGDSASSRHPFGADASLESGDIRVELVAGQTCQVAVDTFAGSECMDWGLVEYDVIPPNPAGTIESLSALGYSLEAAIADLIDNSIDAGATRVDVRFHWAGRDSHVAIIDDGRGMSEKLLVEAMTIAIRGPRSGRSRAELGRFGMGLKTASFSQATTLVVWSKAASSHAAVRVWDLEHVVKVGDWQLLHSPSPAAEEILGAVTPTVQPSGTIVLWCGLTKLIDELSSDFDDDAHRHFLEAIARVEVHLAMTFERFLAATKSRARTLQITINGTPIAPWDPFMTTHGATLIRPVEHFVLEGERIRVRPYVLPPKRRLTDEQHSRGAGPAGWLGQQGFYVYRNDRLIVSGGWLDLGGFRKDEKHVLARIAIELPASVDHLWSIDVKKASARPPISLRGSLTRTAKATRGEAQRILSAISRVTSLEKSDELSFAWRAERANGELRLKVNWQHPLVKEALQISPEARPVVRALLRFLEETVPLPALRLMFDVEEDRDHVPFADTAPDEIIRVAERLFAAYISQGLSPSQAETRLRHTSPFNEYPDLPRLLNLP
jgi:hypothetical protein